MPPATPYTETNALLAVMDGDQEQCMRLLADMLPGEVRRLLDEAQLLADLCRRDLARRRNETVNKIN